MKSQYLVMPSFDHNPQLGVGILNRPMIYIGTKVKGYFAEDTYTLITHNGDIIIRAGYRWDYGSGPAIDDVPMIYASLFHDAIYDLIDSGILPKSARRPADAEFRKLLRRAGASMLRSWVVYVGVRVGYYPWKLLT